MKKVASFVLALFIAFTVFAFPVSAEKVPDVYPEIKTVERTDDGDIKIKIIIYNRKYESIDGFALYDFWNNSAIKLGGKTYNISKWLNVTIKPRTAKCVKIKIKADSLMAEDITGCKYQLYYSCWCGNIYIYGKVTGENNVHS